jgi:lipid-binding SYLF domain-containing protein
MDDSVTMDRFYAQDPTHRDLAQKAAAVLVFPQVTEAGAGVGGEYGEGRWKRTARSNDHAAAPA